MEDKGCFCEAGSSGGRLGQLGSDFGSWSREANDVKQRNGKPPGFEAVGVLATRGDGFEKEGEKGKSEDMNSSNQGPMRATQPEGSLASVVWCASRFPAQATQGNTAHGPSSQLVRAGWIPRSREIQKLPLPNPPSVRNRPIGTKRGPPAGHFHHEPALPIA